MRRGRYTAWRRASQVAFAGLFLALPVVGGTAITGAAVALKLGPVDLLEPASTLSAWLAAGTATAAALLGVVPFVLATASLGSVFCGWICPYGLLSEGLDRLPQRPHGWRGRPWLSMRAPRLVALGVLLAASALLAAPVAALLAPPRMITVLPVEALVLRAAPLVTLPLLGAVVVIDLLVSRRILCRALCPVGGLSALLRARAWRPRWDRARCSCAAPACLSSCAWGLDPREMRGTDGCTSCLACVERCPSGALSIRAARPLNPTLSPPWSRERGA